MTATATIDPRGPVTEASDAIRERGSPRSHDQSAALAAITAAELDILVVDDEATVRESCAALLRHDGHRVTACARGQEAIDLLAHRRFDIVLADLRLAHVDGLAVLRAAQEANEGTLVIMMTGQPSVESSITALRKGAWEYLPKPFSATQLQILVGRAAHSIRVRAEQREAGGRNRPQSSGAMLRGASPAFRTLLEQAARVAATDASVFITGESGAGKELIARFIHERSRRAARPFVAVNCAALPETLLESEMFGHRKGAFTDAVRDKPGLMEAANRGTLFLDELLEMTKAIQAKVLRVIQDGVVRRVGSESTDAVVDVRFIAATNRSPEQGVHEGVLREDLFYRLRVVPIRVPALRERREDIRLLAEHFLETYWRKHRPGGAPPPTLTSDAVRALERHPWPGNVRELQNVIEHAVVLHERGASIDAGTLVLGSAPTAPLVSPVPQPAMEVAAPSTDEGYHAARDRIVGAFEVRYITWLFQRAGGNMSRAARIAGIDRATLYRLIERHDLQRSPTEGWLMDRSPECRDVVAVAGGGVA